MERYKEYKDSGVQWIGDVPSHWTISSVRSIVQEYVEKNKPEKTRELLALSYSLGVTLYRDKKFNMDRVKENYEEYKIVHENVLVVSPNDIIKGSAYVSKYYGCISPMYLTFKSRFEDPTYLLYLSYLLRTKQAGRTFFSLAKGLIGSILDNGKYVTRRMSVSRNDLLSFKIVLPPLPEQKKIVEFIDSKTSKIDSFIAEKEKEVRLLNELKEAEIANVVTQGLNPKVKMKDSGIFWQPCIPNHWKVTRLKNILTKLDRPRDPNNVLLVCSNSGEVKERGDNKLGLVADSNEIYQGVKVGDLLIHGMDTWHGAIAVSNFDGMCTPVVHVCDSSQEKEFVALYLRNMASQKIFKLISNGVRQNTSDFRSWSKLGCIPIALPPIEEQQTIITYISSKCNNINSLITELQAEIDYLKEYKQRLIADCVTGQINVQNE